MENKEKRQSKPESARLNLFYLLHVLDAHTDEEHPLPASKIAELVNKEFGYLSASGTLISADTVKRTLEELIDKMFPMNVSHEERLLRFGYYICCVVKDKESQQYRTYRSSEDKNVSKKYYYLENDLSAAEICTLKDAVETYSYFSEDDITDIVRKLVRLRPHSFPNGKYYDVASKDRDDDSLLLMNIADLNEIILKKKCAKVTYCYYDRQKKLVPRPGYPKVVEPVGMMWSNGYYYLQAYYEKYDTVISMRIDRMSYVEMVNQENKHSGNKLNPVQYRHEHPIMFSGPCAHVELLCRDTGKNYIVNTIMDVFGKNAKIYETDAAFVQKHVPQIEEEEGVEWLRVVVQAVPAGVEMWATQYCGDCIVIAPTQLAQRVKQRLEKGIQYYN